MVTIPAVIQAGSEAKLCASLLQPNETLVMTVSLIADGQSKSLLQESSDQEFHRCFQFQAPYVKSDKVQNFKVEVRGETFLSTEERKVMIKPYSPMTFVQTDKPIYNPGQTVQFRVIALDTNFSPVNQLVSVENNRIGQWVNTSSSGNILQLSHTLNSEAPVGSYAIVVWIGDNKIYHHFKVEKYGMLSFVLLLFMLSNIMDLAEYKVEVCAIYTYGQPVPGKAEVELCQPLRNDVFIGLRFDVKNPQGVPDYTPPSLSYLIGKLTFVDTPKIFEHGSIIEGKINVVHFNNTPISDMLVYLLEKKGWSSHRLQNLTTDSHGIASFSLNTTTMPKDDITLIVSMIPSRYRVPYFNKGEHVLSLIQPTSPHSKTSSSLAIQKMEKPLACGEEVSITIQYAIVGETVPKGSVDVIYLALSRGVILQHGHMKATVQQGSPVTEGEVTLKLAVVPEMAPVIQVLVYSMLPSETVIAHRMNFPTEKCFRHKVFVEFSPSKAVPGEENTLQLSAQPGSLCGLSTVDKSVHIMEPGKRLDADKVTELTEVNNDCFVLVVAYRHYSHPIAMDILEVPGAAPLLPPIQTVRTFFPETWIWDLVEVGESGTLDIPLTVPDTITTWETEAFCLAPGGFGLAPPVEITVFQPFFLELTLPYSIIRGEYFELKATVFNYLSKCIMCISFGFSMLFTNYTLTPLNDVQYSSCLCANGRKTFSWTMAPSVLGDLNVSVSAEAVQSHTVCDNEIVNVPERGRIDTVTQSLLVKAEGTEKTDTYNWLLCPTGETLTEEVELQLPKNVVDGSARISISVLGDILGRALKNLDGLLQMPYGCGEQNMALLAPNIYILEYLRNTEQLTPAIRDKANKFLTSGYQRQLNYKHFDGAYSTFGQGSGNTWLTAFVLRSFGKAQSFIYIDPAKIKESTTWLERQQGKHGCFVRLGKLFNNRMKGGVTDEVTLTAYITASMLELNMSDPVVHGSLSCLRNSTSDLSNTYTTALLAYTFTLAGDMETRAQLLQHLDTVALQEGGLLHWTQTSSETSASLAVEISSYVLLASLNASPLSTTDLGYASRIVRWLVRQQNAYGGFSSTQDTVVALQALALYSTMVFSREGASTVTVQFPSGGQHLFEVNKNNKLLYQERALQDTEGKYSVEVKGSACASVQVKHFNNCEQCVFSYNFFISQQLPSLLPFNHTLDIIQELPVQNLKPAVVKIYDYYQPRRPPTYQSSCSRN
uniref:Uncharacterized protein n=1 Tax=Hucho hucho TaxID=62062 RepID=A0A4W5JGR5_9TELE